MIIFLGKEKELCALKISIQNLGLSGLEHGLQVKVENYTTTSATKQAPH